MEFLQNVPLAPYTTFKIGGPAGWFAKAESEADLVEAVQFARDRNLRLFVLGGGSNLLVADAGFPGLVVRIGIPGIKDYFEGDQLVMRVGAGEEWDKLVSHSVALDCAGLECLAGIPGTVGGTPVQNVGAYGQEVSQTIQKVRALDLDSMQFVELSNPECGFGYRQSLFNSKARGRYIVTQVEYALLPGGAPTFNYADLKRYFQNWKKAPSLVQVAEAVRAIRREKGMFLVAGDPDCSSAGSFFKNPVVDQAKLEELQAKFPAGTAIPQYPFGNGQVKLAAAWLLDQAGFSKGYGSGPAGISTKHTLALVNRGGATAADVLALSNEVVATIKNKFGIILEPEPVLLGPGSVQGSEKIGPERPPYQEVASAHYSSMDTVHQPLDL